MTMTCAAPFAVRAVRLSSPIHESGSGGSESSFRCGSCPGVERSASEVSFVQLKKARRAVNVDSDEQTGMRERLVALLKAQGAKLKSPALSTLAMKARAAAGAVGETFSLRFTGASGFRL